MDRAVSASTEKSVGVVVKFYIVALRFLAGTRPATVDYCFYSENML
jgi:hypothetical protein